MTRLFLRSSLTAGVASILLLAANSVTAAEPAFYVFDTWNVDRFSLGFRYAF